jgi:hypothetical protein
VNMVMNFQFYRMRGLPSLDEELLGTLESLCFIELVTEVVRARFRHFNVTARGVNTRRIDNCTLWSCQCRHFTSAALQCKGFCLAKSYVEYKKLKCTKP